MGAQDQVHKDLKNPETKWWVWGGETRAPPKKQRPSEQMVVMVDGRTAGSRFCRNWV